MSSIQYGWGSLEMMRRHMHASFCGPAGWCCLNKMLGGGN